ncbi:hypothetical protein PC120_g13669 [Phytophthora cactorum]|nr:hypothetical protein PC120_g13669 [Phytophthora cactorum]
MIGSANLSQNAMERNIEDIWLLSGVIDAVLDYEWLELLASQQYGDGFPVVCRPSQIGFVQHNASLLSTVPFDGLATTA